MIRVQYKFDIFYLGNDRNEMVKNSARGWSFVVSWNVENLSREQRWKKRKVWERRYNVDVGWRSFARTICDNDRNSWSCAHYEKRFLLCRRETAYISICTVCSIIKVRDYHVISVFFALTTNSFGVNLSFARCTVAEIFHEHVISCKINFKIPLTLQRIRISLYGVSKIWPMRKCITTNVHLVKIIPKYLNSRLFIIFMNLDAQWGHLTFLVCLTL